MAKKKLKSRTRKTITFYTIMAPFLLMFIGLKVYPFVWGVYMSLTNYTGFNANNLKYVGLANYERVLIDTEAMTSIGTTVKIGLIVVPLSLLICNILALILSSSMKGVGAFRTIYYLPSIIPSIAITMMWQGIFLMDGGLLNAILNLFGKESVNWLGFEWVFRSLCIMMLWSAGAGILNVLSGIKAIPEELYEAARIDGANYFQITTKITLPLTANMNFVNLLTGIIASLQLYSEPILLSGNSMTAVPLQPIYTYMVHVFQQIFTNLRFGYGLALSWLIFVIIVVATLISNRITKGKFDY